jgi:hypothetical protein
VAEWHGWLLRAGGWEHAVGPVESEGEAAAALETEARRQGLGARGGNLAVTSTATPPDGSGVARDGRGGEAG